MGRIRTSWQARSVAWLTLVSLVSLPVSPAFGVSAASAGPSQGSSEARPRPLDVFAHPGLAALGAVSASKTISVTRDAPASAGAASNAPSAMREPPSPVGVRRQPNAGVSVGTRARGLGYFKGLDNRSISFIENRGQADRRAAFYARNGGKTLWLTRKRIVFDITRAREKARTPGTTERGSAMWPEASSSGRNDLERLVFSESLEGADPALKLVADQPRPGVFNYFIGRDRADWHTEAKSYALVTYREAWRGVDMRLYGLKGDLEQEFVVKSGADPGRIAIALSGISGLGIDHDGALLIHTALGDLKQDKPFAYQTIDGKRRAVAARFKLGARGRFGFELASYDRRRPLVIDPALIYSTYLGGVHDDQGRAIAVDANGNAYVAGLAASEDFPVSANAYQLTRKHIGVYVYNAFVTKFSPSGVIIYSTFLGGSGDKGLCNGRPGDCGNGIAIDANGDAFVAGQTGSSDFPVTASAFQRTFGDVGSTNAFISELSPDGSALLYSTYLGSGGNVAGIGIKKGPGGIYVDGTVVDASSFPTTAGAFQRIPKGNESAFVAKIAPSLSGTASLIYSTLIGGSSRLNYGGALALTLDSLGDAFVAGQTHSSDYPTTAGAYQQHVTLVSGCNPSGNPRSAPFVTEVAPDGGSLVFSTFLSGETINGGACDQWGSAIALDSAGNIWVQGQTDTKDFPLTGNAYGRSFGGGIWTSFVAELNSNGTALKYGTYLSGNGNTFPAFSMFLDAGGDVVVGGQTSATNFPVTGDALLGSYQGGGSDGFVTELEVGSASTTLAYSSYIGGNGNDTVWEIAPDASDNIYIAGSTSSTNFPTSPNAFQTKLANGRPNDSNDAFVMSLGSGAIGSITPKSGGNAGSVSITIRGAGFESGATAKLTAGANALTAANTAVSKDGSTVFAIFDLTTLPAGGYTVTVENPDTTLFSSRQPFKVVAGGGPKLSVNVIGRAAIRVNTPSQFYVTITNAGNDDAFFAQVMLFVPSDVTVVRNFTPMPPPPVTGDTFDYSTVPDSFVLNTENIVPFLVPDVPAGQSFAIPVIVSDPNLESFYLQAEVQPPWSNSITDVINAATPVVSASTEAGDVAGPSGSSCSTNNFAKAVSDCLSQFNGLPTSCLELNAKALGVQYAIGAAANTLSNIGTFAGSAGGGGNNDSLNTFTPQPYMTDTQWGQDIINQVGKCAQDVALENFQNTQKLLQCLGKAAAAAAQNQASKLFPPQPPACKTPGTAPDTSLTDEIDAAIAAPSGLSNSCSNDSDPNSPSPSSSCSSSGGSVDPNDKTGPRGPATTATSQGWIAGTTPVSYDVAFENKPSATLPAQRVVITDQLDPTKVNVSTVTLGAMTFGKFVIVPPPNQSSFFGAVDFGPSASVADLSVDVQGSVDTAKNRIMWTFQSIDNSTGLPPADPSAGFLPPNTSPPAGDGSVVFVVKPKPGLPDGLKLSNQASIVFDTNAPLSTPVWTNQLAEPVFQPLSLSATLLAFGKRAVFGTSGASAIQKVAITNPGGKPILVNSITASDGFQVTNATSCQTLLRSGQSCVLKVVFQPLAVILYSGALKIFDNANGSPQVVALSGTGVAGKLSPSPTSLAFGDVKVSTTSASKLLTLTNATGAMASVVSLAPSAGFVTSNDLCTGMTLAPHASCTVDVAFSPTSAVKVAGDLTVTTDSVKTQKVPLSGTGVP